jgi:hypothetical protein
MTTRRDSLASLASTHNLVLSLALIAACGAPEPQKKETRATPGVPRPDTVALSGTAPHILTEGLGPRLVSDSSVSDARLDVIANEYVLRISLSMARVLQDSLPDFAPTPRKEFDKSVLSWVAGDDSLARPLSVAVGDFDGDGQQDAAMTGVSRDTSATVLVLARPDAISRRQIVYIHRPLRSVRTWPASTFLRLVRRGPFTVEIEVKAVIALPADAVEWVGFEKGSVLYYLDRGKLREVLTAD